MCYGTLIDLITSLKETQAAGQLTGRLSILTHPSVPVVDEIGYLLVSCITANCSIPRERKRSLLDTRFPDGS